MLNQNFVILAVLIGSIGGISYLIYTLQGKVRPNKVSFFLWSLTAFITFFAQIKQGVGIQSLLTFGFGFIPLLIFIASFLNKKSEWRLQKFDLACGLFSIIGIVLWIITKIGNVAILFSILANALAALPTIIKSYHYPKTEAGWTYLTASIGAFITIFTIQNWSFENYAFPLYALLVNFVIFILAQFDIKKIIFG